MARSAAARLLASAPLLRGSSYRNLRRRHPPLLLPTSRSKATTSRPRRPQPRGEAAPAPTGSGRQEPAALFHEISGLVASVDNGDALRPRRNGGAPGDDLGAAAVGCTEGARGIDSERAALVSASIADGISDRLAVDDDRADGGSPRSCGTGANAVPDVQVEASCREATDTGTALDSDAGDISAMTHRIAAVLRSEAPGPSMEQLSLEQTGCPSDQNGKVSSFTPSDDTHRKEQEQDYSDGDVEEICRVLSSSDDWGSTQQTLEMRPVRYSPNLVDAVLKRCRRNSCAALQFFSWVSRRPYYTPTTKAYNTAMKLAGSAKDFKHMRYLYREMLRTGCSPTVDTWNVMVCQYGNAGLSEKALEAFCDMKKHEFLPDKTTYQHLIMYLTHSKGRKIDAAVTIFREMCREGHIPDNKILFMYLLALCECQKIADATSSVVSLCKRGFSVQVGYSIFLRSLCRSDRMEEALRLFDSIEELGCSRDQYMYGSLIHALLRRDKFEDAVAKLTEMKNEGILQSAHIYTSFIVYYFQKREVVKALDALREMKENACEPTIVTYSALIRGYMAMGMVSEAWDVFQQMKLKGPAPDFETYSMFMSCLCKAGRSEDGLHLIHDMSDRGFIPSTVNFRTVVHGLNLEGKHELAESVLRSKWHLRKQRIISY